MFSIGSGLCAWNLVPGLQWNVAIGSGGFRANLSKFGFTMPPKAPPSEDELFDGKVLRKTDRKVERERERARETARMYVYTCPQFKR